MIKTKYIPQGVFKVEREDREFLLLFQISKFIPFPGTWESVITNYGNICIIQIFKNYYIMRWSLWLSLYSILYGKLYLISFPSTCSKKYCTRPDSANLNFKKWVSNLPSMNTVSEANLTSNELESNSETRCWFWATQR